MGIFTSSYREDLGEDTNICFVPLLTIFPLPSLTTITSAIQKQNVRAAGMNSQFR